MQIVSTSEKRFLRLELFRFLEQFGYNIREKLDNVCGKTGAYNIPLQLFQKRTTRKNRALISWKTVRENKLTMKHLESFEGGIVVDFINDDFFDEGNRSSNLFNELKKRLGSDENVSSIISIRSENGSSSSALARAAFEKLTNNTTVVYKGKKTVLHPQNYRTYAIKQNSSGGKGNEKWNGFLYVAIRGGQQDIITTHNGKILTIFNPACEYASADVCEDINLVMGYYAMVSIRKEDLDSKNIDLETYNSLRKKLEETLKLIKYDHAKYTGNLYDYVRNQYSISSYKGQLTDPIQLKEITIDKFNISERYADSIDLTHEESVIPEKYYWDNEKNCILSPARPTNLFWSYHRSNMMQQDFGLEEYFKFERECFCKREKIMKKSGE